MGKNNKIKYNIILKWHKKKKAITINQVSHRDDGTEEMAGNLEKREQILNKTKSLGSDEREKELDRYVESWKFLITAVSWKNKPSGNFQF